MKSQFKTLPIFCALALAITSTPAHARDWTGAASANWSNPNNWSPIGVPTNGDSVTFGDVSDSHRAMINDLTNLKLKDVTFVNNGYQLDGNSLEVDGVLFDGDDTSNNSHTTTINCPLVFTGHGDVPGWNAPRITMGLVNGAATETTIYLHLNGPITLNGNLDLFAYASQYSAGGNDHLYVSGVISGTGDIHAFAAEEDGHTSTIEFNGTPGNTFTGTLNVETVGAGQIIFNKSSGVVVSNGIGMIRGDGFPAATANLNIAAQNQIDTNATITVYGGSQLHLMGNSASVGYLVLTNSSADTVASVIDTGSTALELNGGIVSWNDNSSVIPAVKGKLNLNGPQFFTTGGSQYAGLELPSVVASSGGDGGFTKLGTAALLLEASNTFYGPVFANEGILDLRNNHALGDPVTSTFLGGGSLTLRNVTIPESLAVEQDNSLLFSVGTCAWTGTISLGENLVVWADDTSLTGLIQGSGGIKFLFGTATIGGSAANTFTGTLLSECELLQLNKPSGTKAYAGPLVVGDTGIGGPYEVRWLQSYQNVGATLTLYTNAIVNLNNHNEDFGPVTFNGGEVDTGTGQFAIYQPLTVNANNTTATINGNLGLPSGDSRYFNVADGAAEPDLLVNAVMLGSPTYFVKQGPGTVRLAGANTFSTTTLHEGGTLDLANTAALGSGGCVISDGATLRPNFAGTMANNFEATGAGVGGTAGAFQIPGSSSVTLSGSIQLDANTTFNINSAAALALSGVINGAGALTKNGGGTLTLNGSGANTYPGLTTVNSGEIILSKSSGAVAIPGNLTLGPAPSTASAVALFQSHNSIGGNTVTINANSALNLNGKVQTLSQLTLNDGGRVDTGAGTLNLTGGATVSVGSLNLLGSKAGSAITGNIGIPPNDFAINFIVGAFAYNAVTTAPELDVPANITLTAFEDPGLAPTRLNKNGSGRMRFAGTGNFRAGITANGGTLQVDGSLTGGVTVRNATLDGTGTVGPIAMTSSASVVSPGHSPGILTCSNFNSTTGNGIFKVQLNGTTPGTGYSQLNVNGSVNLSNITLQATLGYASAINDTYTIIANDGLDFATGTFNGLPQNSEFYIGGQLFQINYGRFGGLGKINNDVTITRLVTPPPPPMLAIEPESPSVVRVLWPTNGWNYTLQFNADLEQTNWSIVGQTPVIIGTNNVVTNDTATPQQFYRLRSP